MSSYQRTVKMQIFYGELYVNIWGQSWQNSVEINFIYTYIHIVLWDLVWYLMLD